MNHLLLGKSQKPFEIVWLQRPASGVVSILLVFGGEVALVGNAVYYNQRVAKGTSDDERRFYRDVRGRFLWWFLAVHLLNVLDAYVDAHLWNFDTGPDLSLHQKTEEGNWVFVRLDWAF